MAILSCKMGDSLHGCPFLPSPKTKQCNKLCMPPMKTCKFGKKERKELSFYFIRMADSELQSGLKTSGGKVLQLRKLDFY